MKWKMKMNKYKMEINTIGELLIGKSYHSTARTGWGEIVESKLRGDVHFPNGFVFAIRVKPYPAQVSYGAKEFWATVGIVS
jgi:hypothetical protein